MWIMAKRLKPTTFVNPSEPFMEPTISVNSGEWFLKPTTGENSGKPFPVLHPINYVHSSNARGNPKCSIKPSPCSRWCIFPSPMCLLGSETSSHT